MPRNLARAEELYRYAAQKGNAKGWDGLARVAADKGDTAGAEKYFELGVRAGYSNAMMGLSALIWDRYADDAAQKLRAITLMFKAKEACTRENGTTPGACDASPIDANIQIMANSRGSAMAQQLCLDSTRLDKAQSADCGYLTERSLNRR